MKTVLHKANTRGHANHGWLDTYHTFSFANYYDPKRIHFGVLRVLNDDIIDPAMGFGKHPHDNMEIITIPLEGDLEHKDSMGNTGIIRHGDIQVMSAGSGIFHSEYNANSNQRVNLLQIWLIPNKKNVEPRYDQISIRDLYKQDQLYQILSPNKNDAGVWIHQDAWFHMGDLSNQTTVEYRLQNNNNGIYLFIIKGTINVAGFELNQRDGLGIEEVNKIEIQATSDARILLMEIPMNVK